MKNQLQFLIIQTFGQTFGPPPPWGKQFFFLISIQYLQLEKLMKVPVSFSAVPTIVKYICDAMAMAMLFVMPSLGMACTVYSENDKKKLTPYSLAPQLP
jgi:hypothetical protein